MKYAISILALVALFFAADGASSDDRDATAAETASVAEALGGEGCALSDEVEVDGEGVFEADGVVCEDGNYDVELDADFNILSKVKVRPADAAD
ncbi:MAG TPA: hypothetical protein PKC29_09850 [Thermodesulfobacteriota bacterium]|nr:hypothetical protein [Thermodesulfobacteriota bacterium]